MVMLFNIKYFFVSIVHIQNASSYLVYMRCYFQFIGTFILVFIVFHIIFWWQRDIEYKMAICNVSMTEITISMTDIALAYKQAYTHNQEHLSNWLSKHRQMHLYMLMAGNQQTTGKTYSQHNFYPFQSFLFTLLCHLCVFVYMDFTREVKWRYRTDLTSLSILTNENGYWYWYWYGYDYYLQWKLPFLLITFSFQWFSQDNFHQHTRICAEFLHAIFIDQQLKQQCLTLHCPF